MVRRNLRRQRRSQLLAESIATALTPAKVRHHPARNPIQPQPRLVAVRHDVKTPPGNQERLRDHIRSISRLRCAAQSIRKHRPRVSPVQGLESRSS